MIDLINSIEIQSDRGALDFVTLHLLSQNEKSECEGSCYYRSKDVIWHSDNEYDENEYEFSGKACAAGALIKDSEYNEDFENEPASDPHVVEAIKTSHPNWDFDTRSKNMVLVLQRIHDSHSPYEWPLLLKSFGELYDKNEFILDETVEAIMDLILVASYKYLQNYSRGFLSIENNKLREKMIGGK